MNKLEMIAIEAVSCGPSIKYESEEDEVGCFACCGEVSYHDHSADCWFPKMVEELRSLGHAV